MLITVSVPLLQVPNQSLQPADVSLEAVKEAAEASVEAVAQTSRRQSGQTQMSQPSRHRQSRLALGGSSVHGLPASSTQLQKQHLLLKQTQQLRQQSQQASQQLPQQLQQQASSQLSEQPANKEQSKQQKETRHKRKLEDAFGEVRDEEQTPEQAGVTAAEDEQGKRQRILLQEQASVIKANK